MTFNEVYTKVRTNILNYDSSAYVTSTYTPAPPRFPCVFVREIGRYTPTQYVSLSNTENVQECTIEAQIFSNKTSGAKNEAEALLAVVEGALRKQYFVQISSAPVDNADTSVYRLVSRFRRIVADADSIVN